MQIFTEELDTFLWNISHGVSTWMTESEVHFQLTKEMEIRDNKAACGTDGLYHKNCKKD